MAIEKYVRQTLDFTKIYKERNLEKTEFGLLNNYIIFFDRSNKSSNSYLLNNLQEIQDRFRILSRKFIYLPLLGSVDNNTLDLLKFDLPFMSIATTVQEIGSSIEDQILNYIMYIGPIQSGFIETNFNYSEVTIFDLANTDNKIQHFITDLEYYIKTRKITSNYRATESEELGLNSPVDIYYNEDDKIEVEEEVAVEIKNIIKELDNIKQKGMLLSVLPIIEELSKNYGSNLNHPLSDLFLNEDYKLILIDYNVEVKLSHLTKSLYILFLLHPKGLTFEDLEREQQSLIRIYCSVSNQGDLVKLKSNVNNLVGDKNAFYVHLSRVKSTFYKMMNSSLADSYIINGGRNKAKRITLDRSKVNVKSIEKYFQL